MEVTRGKKHECGGVLPGTFIMCGEYAFGSFRYCSDECELEHAFVLGGIVLGGLMGMAEAIQRNHGDSLWHNGRRYAYVLRLPGR